MKKIIITLFILLLISFCIIIHYYQKVRISNVGTSTITGTNEKLIQVSNYRLIKERHFLNDNPNFMGKAMHFSYQEYSGYNFPAITYPVNYYFRKGLNSSISFRNISSKKIVDVEIFFNGYGDSKDTSLFVNFNNDFIPGENYTVYFTDSFFGENEYRLNKIDFYFDDKTMESASSSDLNIDFILKPLDLTGEGKFFIEDPYDGYYNLIIKDQLSQSDFGFYKLTITKQNGEVLIVKNNIYYDYDDDYYKTNLWGEMPIEDLCFAKNINLEFETNDNVHIFEEISNSQQLEKISMWVAAFTYTGYR